MPSGSTDLVRNHTAKTRVEADERAASDRDPWRSAGHHVVVARPVVALVVSNRSNDRQIVRDGGQPSHQLREVDPGRLGCDRAELTADLGRGLRLWIKRLVVTRSPIHPNQNAGVGLSLSARSGRAAAAAVARSAPQKPPATSPPNPNTRLSRREIPSQLPTERFFLRISVNLLPTG